MMMNRPCQQQSATIRAYVGPTLITCIYQKSVIANNNVDLFVVTSYRTRR